MLHNGEVEFVYTDGDGTEHFFKKNGLHQIADEWIVAFSVLDGYLARKKKKLRLCLTGESQDALHPRIYR